MAEIERTFNTIPDTVFKPNSPRDFFDYNISYYLPETRDRIADAVNGFYIKIGKILEDDRRKAKAKEKEKETETGLHVTAVSGRSRNLELID